MPPDPFGGVAGALRDAAGLPAPTASVPQPVPLAGQDGGKERVLAALGFRGPGTQAPPPEAERLLFEEVQAAGGTTADPDVLFEALARRLVLDGPAHASLGAVDGLPALNERSLRSRLLQARLWLLCASARPPGRPFSTDDVNSLIALGRALSHEAPELFAARITGQQRDAFLDWVVTTTGTCGQIADALCRSDPSGHLVARRPEWMRTAPAERPLRVDRDGALVPVPGWWRALLEDGGSNTPPPSRLEKEYDSNPAAYIGDPANRLGLRIVQLLLQQGGFYSGTVDGIFFSESWAALNEAADTFQEDLAPLCSVMMNDDYVALSLPRVVRRLFPAIQAMPDVDPVTVLTASGADLESLAPELASAEQARAAAGRTAQPPADNDRPTFFFRAFRWVVRSVVHGIRVAVQRVSRFLERLAMPIRDFLAWLRRAAGQVAALMDRAVSPVRRFILCEPMGTAAVITRFAADRDATLYVARSASPEQVRQALDEVRQDVEAIGWACRLLSFVADCALLLTGPGGWIRFTVRLIRMALPDPLRPAIV